MSPVLHFVAVPFAIGPYLMQSVSPRVHHAVPLLVAMLVIGDIALVVLHTCPLAFLTDHAYNPNFVTI